MLNIIKITTFVLIPFIYIFGGGGLMLTLTFMLAALLDNFESNIIILILAAIGTVLIVFIINNMIFYIIDLFIRDIQKCKFNIYKKRSLWYMYILTFISYFYYTLYEKLKDDCIYH